MEKQKMETILNSENQNEESQNGEVKLPWLSSFQLFSLCVGFIGIQFAWSMQIAFSSRVLEPLGANPFLFGLIWCAGPLTGIIIPPIIGALSDRTWTKIGRRRPFIIIGAVIAAIMLFLFPLSPSLGIATLLLWIMNASANAAQAPYRALVPDTVPQEQQVVSNSYINFAYGAGSIISLGVAPILLLFHIPMSIVQQFLMTSIIFILAIGYSCLRVKEYPKPANIDESKKQEPFMVMIKKFFTYDKEINKLCGIQILVWVGIMSINIYLMPFVVHNIYGLPDMSTPEFNHQRAIHKIIDPISEKISYSNFNAEEINEVVKIQNRFKNLKITPKQFDKIITQEYDEINTKLDNIILKTVPSEFYNNSLREKLYTLANDDPTKTQTFVVQAWPSAQKAAEYKLLILGNKLFESTDVPAEFLNSELGKTASEDYKEAKKFSLIQNIENKATNTAQIALVVLNTVSLLLSLPMGYICYKFSKKSIYGLSLAFAALACLFAPLVHTPFQLCIMAAFIGVTFATALSIPFAMLADYMPKGEEGTSMGIFNMFIAGPQLISAVVVGWIISRFPMETKYGMAHNWSLAFLIASACLFLAIIALCFLKEKRNTVSNNH